VVFLRILYLRCYESALAPETTLNLFNPFKAMQEKASGLEAALAQLQKDSQDGANLLKQALWDEKEKLKKLQNDFAEVMLCRITFT
jgi:hypothetical protein